MALSPGVITTEKDLTFNIQSITSNATGYVGLFRWGPAEEVVSISTNESELVARFGSPDAATTGFFHAASNYLLYSVPLLISRAIGSGAKNSIDSVANTASIVAPLIKNAIDYDGATLNGIAFLGKYPGDLGNSLKVSIADTTGYASWPYASQFEFAPTGTSFNAVVVDEDGAITGTAGTVLERYNLVSLTAGSKKSDGSLADFVEVLRTQSNYVLIGDRAAVILTAGKLELSLVAGVSDNVVANATASIGKSVDLFYSDQVEIARLMTSFLPAAAVTALVDVVDTRKDAVVFTAPTLAAVYNNASRVADIVTYFGTTINKPSSYHFMVDNWKLIQDKYNNKQIWIPCDSDAAGLHARVFVNSDPWFSPAGLNRGQLKNVIKLAWSSNQTQRDVLYPKSINSIVSFPGEGTVLFGDKTALQAPSAFSRINVRTLFIVIKKAIARAARYQLFEVNDFITQSIFRNAVNRYLDDVQGRRGIYRKKVVCDNTNNTPQVVDSNEFVGDIYVDPSKSINNIRLNFVAIGGSVSFEELEG
jgi:hypothetical protein